MGRPERTAHNNGMHPTGTACLSSRIAASRRCLPAGDAERYAFQISGSEDLILRIVILVSLFLGVCLGTVRACSCSGPGQMLKLKVSRGIVDPAYKDFATYYNGTIFIGGVLQRKKLRMKDVDWYEYRVTFKVDRYWKGEDRLAIVVFTGTGVGGDCGFPFKKGEYYVVFASVLKGRFHTSICTLTMEAKYAANIVKGLSLGEGKVPSTRVR